MAGRRYRPGGLRPAALAAIGIAVIFLIWLLFLRGDDDEDNGEPESAVEPQPARIVTEQELSDLADEVGHPVYWAGPQGDLLIETTVDENGNVFLRYVPEGLPPGADAALFLSVGSYPLPDPFGALRKIKLRGNEEHELPNGGLAVDGEKPEQVYLAYPDSPVQIEVFDPSPGAALELATSGRIQPVP